VTTVSRSQFAILLPVVIACTETAPRATAPVVRDSAGVIIVENSGPTWQEGEAWHVSSEPRVDIGVSDGDPNYQLFLARASLRLHDGRIVVANRGSHDLKWYDEYGTFIRAAGGKGGGPGEFEDLRWMGVLPGDSVITYDTRQKRFSVFDPQGSFARSGAIRGPLYFAHSVLDDGSVLMYRWSNMENGVARRFTTIIRFADDGTLLDTIVTVPGAEMEADVRPGPEPGTALGMIRNLLFAHEAVIAPSGPLVYVGTQDRYEIDAWDWTGALVASVRVPGDPRPVTDDWVDAHIEEAIADVEEDQRSQRRASLEETPHVETFPAHGRILVDVEGNLWVQDYLLPGETRPRWTVFDTKHRMLGTVDMPMGLVVRQIGSDFVLGWWEDELGVEHVRLHDLIRPQ
jgi:hypothetical protein